MHTKEIGLRFVRGSLIVGLLLVSFMTSSLPAAHAQVAVATFVPSTHQAATRVFGQALFTTNGSATLRNRLDFPTSVAVDPISGKIFVADSDNFRVLRFASAAALINGANAEAVLGQPNYTDHTARHTRNGMAGELGVFVDAAGRLWVADGGNNRVLRFNNAAAKLTYANADGVLGQPNWTDNTGRTTRNGMAFPAAVSVDPGGRLWVADRNNNRVLRFNNAAALNGAVNANYVLGQTLFTTWAGATTRNGMWDPHAIFVDTGGRLWVADTANSRVLRFNNAAAKPNGANADGVLGQASFTAGTGAISRTRMSYPGGLAVDGSGRLYVSDGGNNRILVFNAAAGLNGAANASYVLGQTGWTTGTANAGGLSAKSLNWPMGMFFDPAKKVLWAVDNANNRVLRYGTP